MDPRTRLLLEAPIARTLLKLWAAFFPAPPSLNAWAIAGGAWFGRVGWPRRTLEFTK